MADVGKISSTDQIKSLKTLSVTNLTKVADAWKVLSSANTAKDRQQFEAARTSLNQTYAALAEIGDTGNTQATKLLDNLSASYERASR